MNAISSVSSTPNLYLTTNQTSFGQSIQDFGAIGSALQSGDLTTAQSALATFQQDLSTNSQASRTAPFGQNNAANADYQSLTTALKSGDLSSAQKAFASLQKDLKGAGKAHRGHHHRGGGAPAPTQPVTTTPSTSTTSTSSTSSPSTSSAAGSLVDVTA